MASAVPKIHNNQQIVEYMETLSRDYFSKIYPGSTILIKTKPKSGKQGDHIVKIERNEIDSTNAIVNKVI